MTLYIKDVQDRLGSIWELHIKPIYDKISKQNPTVESIKEDLKKILRDRPLNDVGAERKINSMRWALIGILILIVTGYRRAIRQFRPGDVV